VDIIKSAQFSPYNPDAKKARAAMVVENVENLVVENFNVSWPATPTPPEAWQIKKRIANGTLDFFYPIYTHSKQTEMSAFWGRGLVGGYLFSPLAKASHPTFDNFDVEGSSILLLTK
jgi:hypothetical protein